MLNDKVQSFNLDLHYIFNALLRQNSDTFPSNHDPADDNNIPGPSGIT